LLDLNWRSAAAVLLQRTPAATAITTACNSKLRYAWPGIGAGIIMIYQKSLHKRKHNPQYNP
jgi:hypothetical protein